MVADGYNIWKGDKRVVSIAEKYYQHNGEGGLIPYAVALYSFRQYADNRTQLLWLRAPLLRRAELLIALMEKGERSGKLAAECDVVSTHLEWMLRQGTLSTLECSQVSGVCKKLCHEALSMGEGDMHTQALLQLTVARLCINESSPAWGPLNYAAHVAELITDPLQRVRVYAKLGFLYRKEWSLVDGYYYGFRALLIGGVPINVRLKALAMLVGYDR